jgi:hypothetical protein
MASGKGRNALLGVAGATRKEIDTMEVLAMKNENMTAAREWENDPNCFLRMLNSPAQQRSRAARRQKDADRERFNNVLNAVAIGAAAFAVTLLVICFVL